MLCCSLREQSSRWVMTVYNKDFCLIPFKQALRHFNCVLRNPHHLMSLDLKDEDQQWCVSTHSELKEVRHNDLHKWEVQQRARYKFSCPWRYSSVQPTSLDPVCYTMSKFISQQLQVSYSSPIKRCIINIQLMTKLIAPTPVFPLNSIIALSKTLLLCYQNQSLNQTNACIKWFTSSVTN